MKSQSRAAFTLIELLVVIAIISIIAAILFPVFVNVREQARKSACLNNTHQLGLAEMQYVQDNDEAFWDVPNWYEKGPFWSDLLMPYVKDPAVFNCPDHEPENGFPAEDSYTPTTYEVSYGMADPGLHSYDKKHYTWFSPTLPSPFTLSDIQAPSDVALLADAVYYWNTDTCKQDPEKAPGVGSWYFGEGNPADPLVANIGIPRHLGGMNFVYADGHSRWGRAVHVPVPGPNDWAGYYPSAKALEVDCTDFTQ